MKSRNKRLRISRKDAKILGEPMEEIPDQAHNYNPCKSRATLEAILVKFSLESRKPWERFREELRKENQDILWIKSRGQLLKHSMLRNLQEKIAP